MASAFWTLEDGRTFSIRWARMAYMLELIVLELKHINGAEEFYEFLSNFNEQEGDIYNGIGGFYRGSETIMYNFDFRTFAPQNRAYFWDAAQKVLANLIQQNNEGVISCFNTLLSMHKSIKKGESPHDLNHSKIVEEDPQEKIGPGWD